MIKRIADFNEREQSVWKESALYHQTQKGFYFLDKSLQYDREYFGDEYRDYSIVAFAKGVPVIAIHAHFNNTTFGFYTWPVTIHQLESAEPDSVNEAYKNVIAYIESLHKNGVIQGLSYYDNPYFNSAFIHDISTSKAQYHAIIDLTLSAQAIKSNVRRRYKNFINWGERNLTTVVLDRNNPDRQLFLDYKNFHIHTSGRQTRNDRSWDLQFEMLERGETFLTLCYLEGKLVSGNLCPHGSETAFYGVGVNDRPLMAENMPIGHYPIFASILHAQSIGLKRFHMNKIEFKRADEKLNQLAQFKSGFTSTLHSVIAQHVTFASTHES